MNMDTLRDATEYALKTAEKNTSQCEVFASANSVRTIRFALNNVLESKSITDSGIGVRVVVDGSMGFSSTTLLEKDAIEETVLRAVKIARNKKPDTSFKSLPSPKGITRLSTPSDARLKEIDVEEIIKLGSAPLEAGLKKEPSLEFSGSTNFVFEECVIMNSLGVDCEDSSSFIYAHVTAEGREGNSEFSGIGWNVARTIEGFSPDKAGEEAVENALKSKGGKTIKPGRYETVFGHYAVADLMEHVLSYAVSLGSVDAGISYFTGGLGSQVAAEELSVFDDGTIEGALASKQVDDEGTPTRRTQVIRNGVLENFLSDSYYANKASKPEKLFESTGNGFRFAGTPGRRYDSAPGIFPTNFGIEPGKRKAEELVSEVKNGVYVGRLWYTYPINHIQGDFTCTNRSNTYLIEDGEITQGIAANSFRINDNLPRLLQKIKGIGKETKTVVVWGGASAIIVPEVHFSDVNVIYAKNEEGHVH
ncbi:TldD/PmbA family protein [Candidatus Micrarchaeota archaeon]|nr:TldD/PmbA family protein [Candidatus Micrarchaeota archaeon]